MNRGRSARPAPPTPTKACSQNAADKDGFSRLSGRFPLSLIMYVMLTYASQEALNADFRDLALRRPILRLEFLTHHEDLDRALCRVAFGLAP